MTRNGFASRPGAETATDRKRKFLASVFLRALGLRGAAEILRTFYTVDELVLQNGRVLWKVSDSLVGRRAGAALQIPGSDLQIFASKKIRKDRIEALRKVGVQGVELAEAEREGAFAAADVVDPSTGEVLLEANDELSERVIAMAQEMNVDRITVFFPEKDDVGSVLSQTLDSSQTLFENMFFNAQTYDFSRGGRPRSTKRCCTRKIFMRSSD